MGQGNGDILLITGERGKVGDLPATAKALYTLSGCYCGRVGSGYGYWGWAQCILAATVSGGRQSGISSKSEPEAGALLVHP